MQYRIEKDTMGEIQVPADKLWGAQTQRSRDNFEIGWELMPDEVIQALAIIKKAAALVNHELGNLDADKSQAIVAACDEISAGKLRQHFPLMVWQTGSGTQTNMNLNEVIANRARQISGNDLATTSIHPNDHVNMSQSSNDTFPTAMHIAAVIEIEERLLPALERLRGALQQCVSKFSTIVKIGRTHLQDATPLTLGQEFSGYTAMLDSNHRQLQASCQDLSQLAIGGTAVGTGINAHPRFGEMMALRISQLTGKQFISAANKFHALTSHDAIVFASGASKALAANLLKIANDIRWLASGPRCGIGEITIPANEPGSSIMPGKVNPTQAEALTMVACQVFGNDAAIGFAASQGNFELNVFKPVIIYNLLQSTRLLADGMRSFSDNCVSGIEAVESKIAADLRQSLMLVTALNPHIGYENAAKIAKMAYVENISLKQAAIKSGLLSGEEFDRHVDPTRMISPQ